MQLRRLTGLEQDKIRAEHAELMKKIAEYEDLLSSRDKILALIKVELNEDKEKYGDDRKTQIVLQEAERKQPECPDPADPQRQPLALAWCSQSGLPGAAITASPGAWTSPAPRAWGRPAEWTLQGDVQLPC